MFGTYKSMQSANKSLFFLIFFLAQFCKCYTTHEQIYSWVFVGNSDEMEIWYLMYVDCSVPTPDSIQNIKHKHSYVVFEQNKTNIR